MNPEPEFTRNTKSKTKKDLEREKEIKSSKKAKQSFLKGKQKRKNKK